MIACLVMATVGAQAPIGTPQILVFVTAPMRDGFVDTSKEIQDTVKDLRDRVKDDKLTGLVDAPGQADIILTVVARGTGSQAYGSRIDITHYYGGTQLQSLPVVANTRWISTVMEVGTFKKELSAAYTNSSAFSMGAWTEDSKSIMRDLHAWIVANDAAVRAKRVK